MVYLETQDNLKARKLHDFEVYGRCKNLRFNGFQTKKNDLAKIVQKW